MVNKNSDLEKKISGSKALNRAKNLVASGLIAGLVGCTVANSQM